MSFSITLTLGAGLLALWVDTRFEGLRPKSMTQGFVHGAISVLTLFGTVGLLSLVYGIPQQIFLGVLLATFLPALVYSLLAGLWMLRALANLTVAGR